jgi:hypothetical protein
MTTIYKIKKWSDEALQAEVAKLDDEVELYWDSDSKMSPENVATILEKGLEGLDEVEMELQDLHWEEFDRLKEAAIDERLAAMRLVQKVRRSDEKRFRELVDDSDKLLSNVDLKQLARQTGAVRCVVTVDEPSVSFQAWQGVKSKGQVDELCDLCTLLNVNPRKLQAFVTCDNDDRPSYDPEPAVFPDHPEREGHEYVTIDAVAAALNETSYGGQLVFMLKLPITDLIANPDAYTKGALKIRKGTLGLIYCFMNGAGSCEDMTLLKDLTLPFGSFSLRLDASLRYGLQSCYGFTDQPWKQGSIEPIEEEYPTTTTHAETPTA